MASHGESRASDGRPGSAANTNASTGQLRRSERAKRLTCDSSAVANAMSAAESAGSAFDIPPDCAPSADPRPFGGAIPCVARMRVQFEPPETGSSAGRTRFDRDQSRLALPGAHSFWGERCCGQRLTALGHKTWRDQSLEHDRAPAYHHRCSGPRRFAHPAGDGEAPDGVLTCDLGLRTALRMLDSWQ